MSSCCAFFWIGFAIVGYVVYTKFFKKGHSKEPKLHTINWKKDTIYLYQFHRPTKLASLSPFCVKLEMFLRMNNIPYENIFVSSARSKYGMIPFIEFNGVHYADSQLIEEKLKEHFKIKGLPSLRDEAFARGLERMVENHTFPLMLKYKILDNLEGFVRTVLKTFGHSELFIWMALPLGKIIFRKKIENRLHTMVGPFSDAEVHYLLKKDLNTLRDALDNRKYLMGDEPTAVDCAVFGQLVTVCWMDASTEPQRLIVSEYPTLQEYQKRLIARYFPSEFST